MNELTPALIAEMYGQQSNDPFLMLVTLNHETLDEPIRFVNNSETIISRGEEFLPFPITINLPTDDGETIKEFSMTFDNVSREIIGALRSITTPMNVKIEMILASNRDYVQYGYDDLLMRSINYNKQTITAKIVLDAFLNVEMTSEKYTPQYYPGLF